MVLYSEHKKKKEKKRRISHIVRIISAWMAITGLPEGTAGNLASLVAEA